MEQRKRYHATKILGSQQFNPKKGNYIMKHPLLIDEVAPMVFRCLGSPDLKNIRLVCREWNRLSAPQFYQKSKSVIKFSKKYPNKTEVDREFEEKLYGSSAIRIGNSSFGVRNVILPIFELPTDYFSERSKLFWHSLNTLKIHRIGLQECDFLFRFSYHMLPQLSELQFTCAFASYCSEWGPHFQRNIPEIPKVDGATLRKTSRNLRTFEVLGGYGYVVDSGADSDFDSDPMMKYLEHCPFLTKVKLEITCTATLQRLVCSFVELRRRYASTHRIDSLDIYFKGIMSLRKQILRTLLKDFHLNFVNVIKKLFSLIASTISCSESGDSLSMLNSLYVSLPILNLHLGAHRLTRLLTWPQLIQNLPPTLETLKVTLHYVNRESNFGMNWHLLKNLRTFEFILDEWWSRFYHKNFAVTNYENNTLEVTFPHLVHLKWNASLDFLPECFKNSFALSCPVLKILKATLEDHSELLHIMDLLKPCEMLEEFEVSVKDYSFTDVDIVGQKKIKGADSTLDTISEFRRKCVGISKLTKLRQLVISSNCTSLTDRSILEGFVTMPNLRHLQLHGDEKCFEMTNDGRRILRQNHIELNHVSQPPSHSKWDSGPLLD